MSIIPLTEGQRRDGRYALDVVRRHIPRGSGAEEKRRYNRGIKAIAQHMQNLVKKERWNERVAATFGLESEN